MYKKFLTLSTSIMLIFFIGCKLTPDIRTATNKGAATIMPINSDKQFTGKYAVVCDYLNQSRAYIKFYSNHKAILVKVLGETVQEISISEYIWEEREKDGWNIGLNFIEFYYRPELFPLPFAMHPDSFKGNEARAKYFRIIEASDIPENALQVIDDSKWFKMDRSSWELD